MILVVDDDEGVLDAVMRMFSREGFVPWPCASLRDVQRAFRCELSPVAVLTDIALDRETGTAVADWVSDHSDVPVWFMSGYGNVIPAACGLRLADQGRVIAKPIELADVRKIAGELRRRDHAVASG